jgi:hypothetical protein
MNNRVDYLSDRLVNLRGKHKTVNDVIPPETIANGVSIAPAPAEKKTASESASAQFNQAQQRRKEQTLLLFNDYEQRVIRRRKQTQLRMDELDQLTARLRTLQARFAEYENVLNKERFAENEELTASMLGERYRTLDRSRLQFFEFEAELELLINSNTAAAVVEEKVPDKQLDFKTMLKQGVALALTVGLTIAAAVIIAAVVLSVAWS